MRVKNLTLLFCLFFLVGTAQASQNENLSQYVYEDTRQLVMLVEDAADLFAAKGTAAFAEFSEKESRWLHDNYYLFVYDLDGKCIFHPVETFLIGTNLINFKDVQGRPAIKMITDVGRQPRRNASGWVFYKWEEPWLSSYPEWKSSYVRKVVTPDNKVYVIGCGLYNMKIEKVFIEQQVDKAADLIAAKGKKEAYRLLEGPNYYFAIMDSYVTVVNEEGYVEVSPDFPAMIVQRSILGMVDKAGRNVGKEVAQALKTKDRMWTSYMWPKGDAKHITRKLVYIRKVLVDGETLYVLMDFFPAMPIWMR